MHGCGSSLSQCGEGLPYKENERNGDRRGAGQVDQKFYGGSKVRMVIDGREEEM